MRRPLLSSSEATVSTFPKGILHFDSSAYETLVKCNLSPSRMSLNSHSLLISAIFFARSTLGFAFVDFHHMTYRTLRLVFIYVLQRFFGDRFVKEGFKKASASCVISPQIINRLDKAECLKSKFIQFICI